MADVSDALDEVERALAAGYRLPYQASAVGKRIFLLALRCGATEKARVMELARQFKQGVSESEFGDLRDHQMRYAIRVADHASELIQEEVNKLLSLADEVFALGELGLSATPALEREFADALRRRFSRQPDLARHAAASMAAEWNHSRWWYREAGLAGDVNAAADKS